MLGACKYSCIFSKLGRSDKRSGGESLRCIEHLSSVQLHLHICTTSSSLHREGCSMVSPTDTTEGEAVHCEDAFVLMINGKTTILRCWGEFANGIVSLRTLW